MMNICSFINTRLVELCVLLGRWNIACISYRNQQRAILSRWAKQLAPMGMKGVQEAEKAPCLCCLLHGPSDAMPLIMFPLAVHTLDLVVSAAGILSVGALSLS